MDNNIKKQIEGLENEIQNMPINQIGKDRDLLKLIKNNTITNQSS